jgi:DNA polymerase/3'-5' exonuclease PolX
MLARRMVDILASHCHRIEVAGSVRRQKADVGDIEIVLVPRMEERQVAGQLGLFDAPRTRQVSLAWEALDQLVADGVLLPATKCGERYRCHPASCSMLQLDIFAVLPPAQWGPLLAVRTGPAEFGRACMLRLRKRGLRLEDGRVLRGAVSGSVILDCPEEIDFLTACGLPWVAPKDRSRGPAD